MNWFLTLMLVGLVAGVFLALWLTGFRVIAPLAAIFVAVLYLHWFGHSMSWFGREPWAPWWLVVVSLVLLIIVTIITLLAPATWTGLGLLTVIAMVIIGVLLLASTTNDDKDHPQKTATDGTTTTTTTTQPKNTTKVPTLKGYELHYYSSDPGVPGGYFGPACVPHGNADKCKRDILERVKHDPMLCSVMLRNFNVLKGVPDKPVRMPGESAADYAGRLNDWNTQVENARKATASKLAKSAARRKQCAAKVAFGFDTMQGFHIEALHGRFYTEFTDDNHNVTQTSKEMDPSKNFAIVATTPDGVVHYIKVDCGHQTVSKAPIPGVPPQTPPPPPPPPKKPPPPPPPPVHHKCQDHPWPEICGTPNSGPEQQGVQEHKQKPTPGYKRGDYEQTVQAQKPPADKYKPNPQYGSNPPEGQHSPPGGSGNPSDPTGTNGGVENPKPNPNPGPPVSTPPPNGCWDDPTLCG